MRYSRFRSAMLGLEPTRRNRTGPPKSRVTKPKKDPKSPPLPSNRDESMKPESLAGTSTPAPQEPTEISAPPPPKIKQESLQRNLENRLENRLTPGLTPGPPMSMSMSAPSPNVATSHTMQSRLLTPCSDTDVFVPAMSTSPTSDLINSQQPSFDFSRAPCPSHEDGCDWSPAMAYASFSNPYVLNNYTTAYDTQHLNHHHHFDTFGMQLPSIETDGDYNAADVKGENWDDCI